MKLAPDFWSSKTTWAGIIAIVTLLGQYSQHLLTLSQMEQGIILAVAGVFIRDTHAKGMAALVK